METPSPVRTLRKVNVADRLAQSARHRPDAPAIVEAWGKGRSITFAQLERDADLLARGFIEIGVEPQKRMALLVKPSIDFVTLVFALLRSGATMVLVDAGLGRKNIVRCLASTEPEGFVAIPLGQAMRLVKQRHFPLAKLNVTVGRRWFWRGKTLEQVREAGEKSNATLPVTTADQPAAIVFTSGSTGPPKGVVYRHETFTTQLTEIERMYGLEAGGIDLACFPLFGLFNVALGITTVLPDMDFSRPAAADPKKLLGAANQYRVTQSFASPAVWDKLSRHCEQSGETIPTLRQVFSCGAPVQAEVMQRTLAYVHPNAQMHTPYGATESLPVSTLEAAEVLQSTAAPTAQGAGVCVGRKVESLDWRVVSISDEPIQSIDQAKPLSTGEIGELIVRGPQVSREYLASPLHNAAAKIADGTTVWHRMGDVGYFDSVSDDSVPEDDSTPESEQCFWYCGRKSHRVETPEGPLYTECMEAIVNQTLGVRRSALVGVGPAGRQQPVVVVECEPSVPWPEVAIRLELLAFQDDTAEDDTAEDNFCHRQPVTYLPYRTLPTDIRHNAKINREKLAQWAARQLAR